METTVTGKNQVTIPARLVRQLNIKPGTRLKWRLEEDGTLVVTPLPSRGELARQLAGVLRPLMKPGDDPVEDLIQDRLREDEEID